MPRRARFVLLVVLLAAPALPARHLELAPVAAGLADGVAITHAGDDRLFVVSKEGRVWIFRDGVRLPQPYLDIRDRVLYTGEPTSEQGLLSLAFHPAYATNGFLFAAYTDRDGVGVVSRFTVSGPNPDQASRGSERVLLRVEQPGPNHNLNHLAFGPNGRLYVASGDGGYQPEPRCTPQIGSSLLGKILRLDVDSNVDVAPFHAIPADNPFVSDPGFRDEIWALGLRNPWRFSFDPPTGDLFVTDVGQNLRDEIDFVPAGHPGGLNFGWKMMEGFACRGSAAGCPEPIPPCFDPAYTPPVLDHELDATHCALIGGHVVRGGSVPELQGAFLVGDYCGATALVTRGGGGSFEREELSTFLPELVAFGADAAGESYLLAGGELLRIVGLADDSTVGFSADAASADEGDATLRVGVVRSGADGAASVAWTTAPGTAGPDDFVAASGILSWADGEAGERTIAIALLDDAEPEGNEAFRLVLSEPIGATLDGPAELVATIVDDDLVADSCVPSAEVLCLHGGRFQVTVGWRDFEGATGPGRAIDIDFGDSGLFWFFSSRNLELMVKVLDGCGINGRWWVFAAATTNVEYRLRVLDTRTGEVFEATNPLGVSSAATTDTGALTGCP